MPVLRHGEEVTGNGDPDLPGLRDRLSLMTAGRRVTAAAQRAVRRVRPRLTLPSGGHWARGSRDNAQGVAAATPRVSGRAGSAQADVGAKGA